MNGGLLGNFGNRQLAGEVVVRNIAFVGLKPNGDIAALFVNTAAGTPDKNTVRLTDVFVSYATVVDKPFAASVVFGPGAGFCMDNVVVVAQVKEGYGAVAMNGTIDTTKWNNVYAISNATSLYSNEGIIITDNLFADAAAMKAAVTELPEGFNAEYWTIAESGLIVFKSVNTAGLA